MKVIFSAHSQDVMFTRNIKVTWVEDVLERASRQIIISDEEVHYFKTIQEYDDRCLKVVFNPNKNLVITTFFDRKMKKKGC